MSLLDENSPWLIIIMKLNINLDTVFYVQIKFGIITCTLFLDIGLSEEVIVAHIICCNLIHWCDQ